MLSSEIDPDEARRAARDILSGAEYAEPQESLVERVVGWIFERLGDAIATLTGGGPGSVIGWVIVLVLGGGAVWLLVRTLQVPGVGRMTDDDLVRYGTESHRDAGAWLREADRLASTGDHRGALRCRYQALLARLINEGELDDAPGRTSGEYRGELEARRPDQAETMRALTRMFEDAWYGGSPVEPADLETFTSLCTRIETAPPVLAGA